MLYHLRLLERRATGETGKTWWNNKHVLFNLDASVFVV